VKLIVYQSRDGWRWRVRGNNNRILADGAESYTRRRDAVKAALRVSDGLWKALLIIRTTQSKGKE
jgi:uncharacterized protein YegP (UPF0339 family)